MQSGGRIDPRFPTRGGWAAVWTAWWLAGVALWLLAAGPAWAGLERGDEARPAAVLVAGGPGGQKELAPLATALEVGGYQVLSLAPDTAQGGLAGLARRVGRAVHDILKTQRPPEVALVAHGAGCLAALSYLAQGHPPELKRALFVATPVEGLTLPEGATPCRQEWRDKVAFFYGKDILAEASPGAGLVKLVAKKGLPLDILAGSVSGHLNAVVAKNMLVRAGCAKDLAGLPGDGVVTQASLAGLPGFGRDDREYRVLGDHLSLPGAREVKDLALGFFKLPLTPATVAVVMVLDGSGSVRSVDAQGLRTEAAKLLISRLAPGDQVGVVSFNTTASTVLPLTQVRSRAEAQGLAAGLGKLPARGDTDIGAGLARAGELLAGTPAGVDKVVVVLTDGKNDPETANLPTLETARQLAAQGVKLHVVGLTDQVDQLFLSGLAAQAKGLYLYAGQAGELVAAFDRLAAEIDRRVLLLTREGRAPAEFPLLVDASLSRLDLSLLGETSKLSLELVGPAGRLVKPEAARGTSYSFYGLTVPVSGEWKIRVRGVAGTPFHLQASGATGLTAGLAQPQGPPLVGKPWLFSLAVRQDDLPVEKCRARVEVWQNGSRVANLQLIPAPLGGFSTGLSSAGVLTGQVPLFGQPGDVQLRAVVTGQNRTGEPFARLVTATVHVSDEAERRALGKTLPGVGPGWGGQP
ncbi:MAG: VWA domain-containing protein [Deltaproteobacteria bacterium]|nr:VWA domain-containing protein [Deltaproteobacteria bacterium]MCB2186352.1 VWA domain-containing protein [Deltaproteobacteria bacterium]